MQILVSTGYILRVFSAGIILGVTVGCTVYYQVAKARKNYTHSTIA